MRLRHVAPQQPVFVLCSCAFEKLVFVRLDLVITSNRVAQLSGDGAVEECEHNSLQHLHPIYTAAAMALTRTLVRGAVKAEKSAQMNERGACQQGQRWRAVVNKPLAKLPDSHTTIGQTEHRQKRENCWHMIHITTKKINW